MPEISILLAARGAVDRYRRSLRQRMLAPILLGIRSFREVVLNALAERGHLIYCRLPEGNFFIDPSDRVIGSWLMWHQGWQREELDQAIGFLTKARPLPKDAVFVDAGANIGTHTVYAMRTGHFARAVAFEPEPRNAELLMMNMAANGLASKVIVLAKALGAHEGQTVLHLHPRNKGAHAIGSNPSADGTQWASVPLTRLDGALSALSIDPARIGLIWIDVEGSEFDLLRGLGDLVGQVPLVIEYSPDRFSSSDDESFRRLLKDHYASFHRLGTDPSGALPTAALDGIQTITDILLF